MNKSLLIDEFRVGTMVPKTLPAPQCAAVRAQLREASFMRRLRRAIRNALGASSRFGGLRITVTR